ncbi:ribonuclease P protein subunit p40-like [Argonauta hians]
MAVKLPHNLRSGKLILDVSNFNHKKSNHDKIVLSHYFNFSLNLILPGATDLPDSLDDILQQKSSTVHFLKNVPISLLIEPEFLEAFCRRGHLYMMSHGTNIDTQDCIALLPTGKLVLNVTKDTYESLGLDGKKSEFVKHGHNKYVVTLSLLDANFVSGKKFYERVKWCFTDRLNLKFNMLACWIPPEDDILSSSLAEYFKQHNYQTVAVGLKNESKTKSGLKVPIVTGGQPHSSIESCDFQEFFDWLGSVSSDCQDDVDEDCQYSFTPTPNDIVASCLNYTIKGFILPQTIQKILIELRTIVTKYNLKWSAMTIHGYTDSPVTWEMREHGFQYNGDNLYTYVIFPEDVYWLYTAVGSLDTWI